MAVDPVRSPAPFLACVRLGLRALARVEVTGVEHVPGSGPCLVVFNQTSLLDTPLLRVAIPRPDVAGLVAIEYRRNPFFRLMVEAGGGIWIERGAGDRTALAGALKALERGWVVGISPEGRRSRTGGLERGKPGVVALAHRASVPIVPMGITNMRAVAQSVRRLRRARVAVRFGEPFRLSPPHAHDRKRQRQDSVDLIMGRLAALLPDCHRGVYAAHPTTLAGGPSA